MINQKVTMRREHGRQLPANQVHHGRVLGISRGSELFTYPAAGGVGRATNRKAIDDIDLIKGQGLDKLRQSKITQKRQ